MSSGRLISTEREEEAEEPMPRLAPAAKPTERGPAASLERRSGIRTEHPEAQRIPGAVRRKASEGWARARVQRGTVRLDESTDRRRTKAGIRWAQEATRESLIGALARLGNTELPQPQLLHGAGRVHRHRRGDATSVRSLGSHLFLDVEQVGDGCSAVLPTMNRVADRRQQSSARLQRMEEIASAAESRRNLRRQLSRILSTPSSQPHSCGLLGVRRLRL